MFGTFVKTLKGYLGMGSNPPSFMEALRELIALKASGNLDDEGFTEMKGLLVNEERLRQTEKAALLAKEQAATEQQLLRDSESTLTGVAGGVTGKKRVRQARTSVGSEAITATAAASGGPANHPLAEQGKRRRWGLAAERSGTKEVLKAAIKTEGVWKFHQGSTSDVRPLLPPAMNPSRTHAHAAQ